MRLSNNEIRRRASRFAAEWAGAHYERGQCQSFYIEFFEVFGVKLRRVASFEEPVKKLGDKRGFIDLFWKGVLLVEQKSAGRNLTRAKEQALDYFPGLAEEELPRFVLVSDFQTFELYDLDEGEEHAFTLAQFPQVVELFGFILGRQKRSFADQDPVNIKASELMGTIHDGLEASGYAGHDLQQFLVRLLFLLFADDTGIFEPRGIFESLVKDRTREDGSDLGMMLAQLFEVLDTPVADRQRALDEDLAAFAHVNGALFEERLRIPAFDSRMRRDLIRACEFSWDAISPAIFGALFQSVMDHDARRAIGAHYTTEKNILKVIGPLFMDDLRADFDRLRVRRDGGRMAALRNLHERMARLRLLDPACGCGNFLVIAYRELRQLEMEILEEVHGTGQLELDATLISRLDVDQFLGVEISEFPARIATVALWMMDHIMNQRLGEKFGPSFVRIPLTTSPGIQVGNALRMDWNDLLLPGEGHLVLGNPPFVGKHLRSDEQQEDMELVFEGGGGTLDYVAAWFALAARWLDGSESRCGFVATNSITQGEQVALLWRTLLSEHDVKIHFAHRTFAWGSDARGKAHVHCVIVGFGGPSSGKRPLYDYQTPDSEPMVAQVHNICPYLVAYDDLIIEGRSRPLADVPRILYGSKPVDGGALLFTRAEYEAFVAQNPGAEALFRPMVSASEYMAGVSRHCLWLVDQEASRIKAFPAVMDRVRQVREFRLASKKAATRAAAGAASEFAEIRQPDSTYVVIPMHTSQRREWIPFGFFDARTIVHNSCTCIAGAGLYEFGVVSSAMHMAWVRYVAGRIKSDYRYSNRLVYNTFPWPAVTASKRAAIEAAAQAVLDARAGHPGESPADLYDPDLMKRPLRRAHQTLDRAVDRAYRGRKFDVERERVGFLFAAYERAT